MEASIEGLGVTSDPLEYDYNLGVTFTKPGVWTPDTSFITSLLARQLDLDNYRETSLTGRVGFSQQFGGRPDRRRLRGGLALPLRGRLRHPPLPHLRRLRQRRATTGATTSLDPARGYYLAAEVYPFYEAEFGNTALRSTLEGRVYFGFGAEERFVLAGRAKVGSFAGAPAAESPPDLLFFAGGGGSVRGYAYRSIGIERVEPGRGHGRRRRQGPVRDLRARRAPASASASAASRSSTPASSAPTPS